MNVAHTVGGHPDPLPIHFYVRRVAFLQMGLDHKPRPLHSKAGQLLLHVSLESVCRDSPLLEKQRRRLRKLLLALLDLPAKLIFSLTAALHRRQLHAQPFCELSYFINAPAVLLFHSADKRESRFHLIQPGRRELKRLKIARK
ncbi:MAG: hypothetical protein AMJ46_09405 [Latescibacteria bacterium DG_63]|nr:MAG: hypothetical protein AMJ46_09405 [Latescibacteria bacterium DG_63]